MCSLFSQTQALNQTALSKSQCLTELQDVRVSFQIIIKIHTLRKFLKWDTYNTYNVSASLSFILTNRVLIIMVWICILINLEVYFSTTCSCVSIEVEFWQQVSHIVLPPVPLLFLKLSESAKTLSASKHPPPPPESWPLQLPPWPLTPSRCSGQPLPQQHAYHTATVCVSMMHANGLPCPPPHFHFQHFQHTTYRIMSYTLPIYFSVYYTDLKMHVHCITASYGTWLHMVHCMRI